MKKKELNILIERYFEGETSVAEEKLLLETLLSHPPGDPEVDETLAVMGYARVANPHSVGRRVRFRKIMTVAASLLVVLAAAGTLFLASSGSGVSQPECYAYIGGERTEDLKQIENIMMSQMSDMAIASDEVEQQLQEDLGYFKGLLN